MTPRDGSQLDGGVSVVVPVYRSEATLAELVRRVCEVMDERGQAFEIILVNDASPDESWERVCELAEAYTHVVGIKLTRNFGQHNALLCGIRAARYAVTVTIDDDLQHPPEEIPRLLERLDEGWDVVYGTPEQRQHGVMRNIASWVTRIALQSAMGAETAKNVDAFRAFHTRLRDAFARYRSPMVSIDVLLTWGTGRFDAVRVKHDPRKHGQSNYGFAKLLAHALNMVTGFSTLPLQIASWIGFGMTLFGVVLMGFVILRYMVEGTPVPGFPFLASVICLFSGAQLFALGMIGEYLARMHWRAMDRPAYVVGERCGQADTDGNAETRRRRDAELKGSRQ